MKHHDLKTTTVNHINISYFYERAERPRGKHYTIYKVFIIDPDGVAVYEKNMSVFDDENAENIIEIEIDYIINAFMNEEEENA